jgi:hypothetical protein
MSLTLLTVEKSGSIKEVVIKGSFTEAELYKKAGFKTAEGFKLQTTWSIPQVKVNNVDKKYTISLYGKTNGRAGQENKYDFPPPVDNTLFFGACVLVNNVDGVAQSLSKPEWKAIYEHLFGGFEDIGDEDSEVSVDDVDENVPRTREGYVKDGFIVDDDDEEDDMSTDESEFTDISSEEEIKTKSKKNSISKKIAKSVVKAVKSMVKAEKNIVEAVEPEPSLQILDSQILDSQILDSSSLKKVTKSKAKAKTTVFESVENNEYLVCTDELEEEAYLE